MELLCYTYPGWKPRIRPASSRRDWMDRTPESFAYRCLPLKIANAHGWELLSPCGFEAVWNGGPETTDVQVTCDAGAAEEEMPVSLFGQGTITFHVAGIFRTPPGWNLWVGGSPNLAKDGISPLGGVIETDWSPFSFTMNWRFTRPGHAIRFEENEPFAFLFPVQRGIVDTVQPKMLSIDDDPELKRRFETWSASRDRFQAEIRHHHDAAPSDKWQKFYYRGVDAERCPHIGDHQTKVKPAPFPGVDIPPPPRPPSEPATATPPGSEVEIRLAKREWLLQTLQTQRALSPRASAIIRYGTISADRFLDAHYAANRPAILTGEIRHWPALGKWTPDYLKEMIGPAPVEFQGNRTQNERYERDKDAHRSTMPFDRFIDMISAPAPGYGNDAYITAYNSGVNHHALSPLYGDLGRIDHLLDGSAAFSHGMLWIGPAGTFTPLHHDLTNNLLLQITGRKRLLLVPPEETPRLYNDQHVFSRVPDLESAELDRFPRLRGLRMHQVELGPGDALFIPVGWWHQVRALDFSISITHTNFIWPNDAYRTYPADPQNQGQ